MRQMPSSKTSAASRSPWPSCSTPAGLMSLSPARYEDMTRYTNSWEVHVHQGAFLVPRHHIHTSDAPSPFSESLRWMASTAPRSSSDRPSHPCRRRTRYGRPIPASCLKRSPRATPVLTPVSSVTSADGRAPGAARVCAHPPQARLEARPRPRRVHQGGRRDQRREPGPLRYRGTQDHHTHHHPSRQPGRKHNRHHRPVPRHQEDPQLLRGRHSVCGEYQSFHMMHLSPCSHPYAIHDASPPRPSPVCLLPLS